MNNQLKKELKIFAVLLIIFSIIFYFIGRWYNSIPDTYVIKAEETSPVASPKPILAPTDIKGYIEYKFGLDASKALQVLSGEGCGENRYFDPNAINDNRVWGGVGRDRGYWQINDVYHPSVSDACAKDVKCSTDYAYRMYVNDGKSFKRWTCGRYHKL